MGNVYRYALDVHEEAAGRPDEFSFCAALVSLPEFPDGKPAIEAIARTGGRYTVAGCNDNGGKWGWVTLSDDEKTVIGDALRERNAEVNRWYWVTLYDLEDQP